MRLALSSIYYFNYITYNFAYRYCIRLINLILYKCMFKFCIHVEHQAANFKIHSKKRKTANQSASRKVVHNVHSNLC